MESIHKTFPVEVLKQYDDGSQDIVISTDAIDRDGEVIEVDGWKTENYLKNPVVMYAHDYRGVPVGRTVELRREPGALVARFTFREPANEFDPVNPIRAAWDQGILRAASVGFRPIEAVPMDESVQVDGPLWYWGPKRYKEQELLEWSIVPIPANQEALRRAFEAYVKRLSGSVIVPDVHPHPPATSDAASDERDATVEVLSVTVDFLKAFYGR